MANNISTTEMTKITREKRKRGNNNVELLLQDALERKASQNSVRRSTGSREGQSSLTFWSFMFSGWMSQSSDGLNNE